MFCLNQSQVCLAIFLRKFFPLYCCLEYCLLLAQFKLNLSIILLHLLMLKSLAEFLRELLSSIRGFIMSFQNLSSIRQHFIVLLWIFLLILVKAYLLSFFLNLSKFFLCLFLSLKNLILLSNSSPLCWYKFVINLFSFLLLCAISFLLPYLFKLFIQWKVFNLGLVWYFFRLIYILCNIQYWNIRLKAHYFSLNKKVQILAKLLLHLKEYHKLLIFFFLIH